MTEEKAPERKSEKAPEQPSKPPADPVRKWTLVVLMMAGILLGWSLMADRVTPYTSQARVHALVVPIAAEIPGTVSEVLVGNNQAVDADQPLFQIDRDRYQLVVETARANLQKARQATGVSTAGVDAAQAGVSSARANLLRAEQDAVRLRRIKKEDPGALSDRRIETAEATLSAAQGQLGSAIANLEKARQDLGEAGDNNARILEAQAALEQAELDWQRTTVRAPDDGLVTDVRVNSGSFAAAGAPQMTFIATQNIWVQADFTENNLGNIKSGDPVEVTFDVLPGQVFTGSIRGIGFGVAVDSAPLGSLPTIDNDRQWLRDEQRFAVVIDFDIPDAHDRRNLRVGAQASVIVYTANNWIFNIAGKIYVRITSLLSYAY